MKSYDDILKQQRGYKKKYRRKKENKAKEAKYMREYRAKKKNTFSLITP